MNVVLLPIAKVHQAEWNANRMDADMEAKLGNSVRTFGLRLPLLVRTISDGFECIAGNMRLEVLRAEGVTEVPCIVADDLSEAQCKLLSLALNRLGGWDDLTAKAKLLQDLNAAGLTAEGRAAVLPDGVTALRALGNLGQASPEAVAEQLRAWNQVEQAKAAAKLHAWTLPFTDDQRRTVMEAVETARTLPHVASYDGPNVKAAALAAIADDWLHGHGHRPATARRGAHLRVVSGKATPHTHKEA